MNNRISITRSEQCCRIIKALILAMLLIWSLMGFITIDELHDSFVVNVYYIFTFCQIVFTLFIIVIVITQHKYVESDLDYTVDNYIVSTFGCKFVCYFITCIASVCAVIHVVISIFSCILFLINDSHFHAVAWQITACMCAPALIILIVLISILLAVAIKKCGTCMYGRYVWTSTCFKSWIGGEKRCATHIDTLEPCSICLSQIVVGEKVHALQCQHTYHSACIDPWLAQSSACPLCRDVVREVTV